MIDVSDEIKQAYDLSTTQVDKIILDGKEYRITNVQYYDDVYEEGNIFGTAIARGLEFEIENIVDLEKKEIEYLTGIQVNGITNWISLGNFIIQDVEPNDTTNIAKITAMDYMIKTNIPFESKLKYSDGTVTLADVLNEACTNSGLTCATLVFPNSNFIVDSNQFEEGTLNRQVIQAVAQLSGTVAKVKSDNKLYLIGPQTTVSKVFTLNNYKEAEIKRATHPINLVSLGMANITGENITLRDETSIAEDGENSLVINDNPFAYTQAKREQLITALFNEVKGFEYKAYTFDCQGLPYLETMDKIQFLDKKGNTYDSYVFRFNYKSPNGLGSTIEAPSIIKATVNYQNVLDAMEIAKHTEILVDKQNQVIESVASNVDDQNEKISKLTQTVDKLSSEISEVADVTISADGYGSVSLANINESEPIRIELRPIEEDIAYLYPRENLYPSNDLYLKNRKLRFATANYSFDWEMPDDLLYYDADNYDELILDYGGQTCQINKKVGYNADGSKYLLTTPKTISYTYPKIPLEAGDYTITLLGYTKSYIFVRLMVQNLYTDQFATKVEMNSNITQLREEINLGVDKKLENYSTTTQMNSAINLKADSIISSVSATYETKTNASNTYATKTQLSTVQSEIKQTTDSISITVSKKVGTDEIISSINQSAEAVQINASKINLSGYLTVSSASSTYATKSGLSEGTTTINGGCITTGTIDASKVTVKNLNASNITSGTISASKISGGSLNLTGTNTTITSTNFSVDESGNITAKSGTIGGWNISNVALWKVTDNYIFEIRTDRPVNEPSFLVWDTVNSRSNFYISPDGYMYARNAEINGTINATSGTFKNCTITSSCSVQGSAIVGTLSGVTINAGKFSGSEVNAMAVGADRVHVNNPALGNCYEIGNYEGKSTTVTTSDGKTLKFVGGILVSVS